MSSLAPRIGFPLVLAGSALDLLDGQVAGVERQLRRRGIHPLQRMRRGAGQLPAVEVDGQVQCRVGDAHLAGLGMGMLVLQGLRMHGGGLRVGGGSGSGGTLLRGLA
jgi:hypothetical protein